MSYRHVEDDSTQPRLSPTDLFLLDDPNRVHESIDLHEHPTHDSAVKHRDLCGTDSAAEVSYTPHNLPFIHGTTGKVAALNLAERYSDTVGLPESESSLKLDSSTSEPRAQSETSLNLKFASQLGYEPLGEHSDEGINDLQYLYDTTVLTHSHWPVTINGAEHTEIVRQKGRNTALTPLSTVNAREIWLKPALKRRRESDAEAEPIKSNRGLRKPAPERQRSRIVSFEEMSNQDAASADDESHISHVQAEQTDSGLVLPPSPVRQRQPSVESSAQGRQRSTATSTQSVQRTGRANKRTRTAANQTSSVLPAERVFPIQMGSELFRLSGASISSDGPSYFTRFFEAQLKSDHEATSIKTLYIDRDPETFRDIARHLQGYFLKPGDGSHFVKLLADAQFYSLPRLIHQLFESEIFVEVGGKHFQIPKDIFSEPGNSPNFFSLGFAVFFSTPGEVFPGADRRGLLRPPSIKPPHVPGRSAETFSQILHLLRGYPLHIRSEEHRSELLRDCRYFHLRGLEQRVIAHQISYNLERRKSEICIRLEDVKPSGICYKADDDDDDDRDDGHEQGGNVSGGWVFYARPFVDEVAFELVIEIGSEATVVNFDEMRMDFHGLTKARVSSLFQVIANKMNLPSNAPLGLMILSGKESLERSASPGHTPLSEDRVKFRFEPASDIVLNGERYNVDWDSELGQRMGSGMAAVSTENEPEAESDVEIMSEDNAASVPASTSETSSRKLLHRGRAKNQRTRAGRVRGRENPAAQTAGVTGSAPRKRRRPTLSSSSKTLSSMEWVVKTGQWRMRVQRISQENDGRAAYEIVFIAVKLQAFSHERERNAQRSFLSTS